MANPILNTRMYARVAGIALAAVALLGIVLNAIGSEELLGFDNDNDAATGFLVFDWGHNILHVVLAAVALYIGFAATEALTVLHARVLGVVYLALGVAGFFWTGFSTTMVHLELGENLIHILLGLWGCAAGFIGAKATTPAPTAPAPTMMRK